MFGGTESMFYHCQKCRHSVVSLHHGSIDLSASKFTTTCVFLCRKFPGVKACLICDLAYLGRQKHMILDPFGVVDSSIVRGTLSEVFD